MDPREIIRDFTITQTIVLFQYLNYILLDFIEFFCLLPIYTKICIQCSKLNSCVRPMSRGAF